MSTAIDVSRRRGHDHFCFTFQFIFFRFMKQNVSRKIVLNFDDSWLRSETGVLAMGAVFQQTTPPPAKCGAKCTSVLDIWNLNFHVHGQYVRVLLTDGGAVKNILGHSTRKNKSNDLEAYFPTSATRSRCPREGTKTAVALPHCCEITKESIAGWWIFRLEMGLEFWRNYESRYVKKTGVEFSNSSYLSALNSYHQTRPYR